MPTVSSISPPFPRKTLLPSTMISGSSGTAAGVMPRPCGTHLLPMMEMRDGFAAGTEFDVVLGAYDNDRSADWPLEDSVRVRRLVMATCFRSPTI